MTVPVTPSDDRDWLPGETEGDRSARLAAVGLDEQGQPLPRRDLGAEWSEQQDGEPSDA